MNLKHVCVLESWEPLECFGCLWVPPGCLLVASWVSLTFSGRQRSRVKSAWKNVFGKCCFFCSVLFPIVQNDSIPTIGHSDIYLFLIPIMSQVGPGSGPSGEVVSYAICVFHTGFTPCPLIPSFQPFLGGGWRRGWMGGCSA